MIPPVYQVLTNTPAVMAILGTDPENIQIYPWSEAPQDSVMPYVTYTVYNGVPENTLGEVPKVDNLGTQVDIWALTGKACTDLAIAVRDALEPEGYMTEISAMEKDKETKLYRLRMSFDFFTFR